MAMSLEDLLAKEGFKRRKEKIKPARTSSALERSSIPLYLQQPKHETGSSNAVKPRVDFSTSSSFDGRKPRDNLSTHGKLHLDSDKRRGRQDSWDANRYSVASSKDIRASEIVEVGTNSNDVYTRNADEKGGKHRNNNSFKHSNPPYLDNRSNRSSKKKDKLEEALAVPALEEAAVKAVISILSGYAKRFVDDEDFRTSLHHKTFTCLNLFGLDEGQNSQSKVTGNLERAIETVERVIDDPTHLKELKKASLQLSVITGLNSDDLKDGFTSGIPNARLSACAHLYLSVIYVLQKKDDIAAKHLLQVLCDSPFQARTTLLPDLWDHVFLPHLSQLKLWYEKQTYSLADSKLLDKVYNESLDSGTYQFAMYYKDWIMDGVEAPSVPLIRIPFFPNRKGHTSSHASPQSMVSKQLYDEVFRHSLKGGTDLMVNEEEGNLGSRSSDSPATEDKQLILYTQPNKSAQHSGESPSDNYTKSSLGQTNLQLNSGANINAEMKENPKGKAFICSIPEDFICSLTGLLFKDPVTLETGQTFEREAITCWFDKGCISCPVTRKALQNKVVPATNLILKRVIDKWKTDHIDHLLAELSGCANENAQEGDNVIICVLGQLLPAFSEDERVTNSRRVISCGGLQFLVRRLLYANTWEKTFILSILCCCIEADGSCRNGIAGSINLSNILRLLHNEHLKLTTITVLLLIELICFNRRSRAKSFLEGLLDDEIINAMDHLSTYLQTCPLEQTPLAAVLILNLDLLSERRISKVYRQEAIDALTVALNQSITDEKVEKKCCRALLILGGIFSSSGKLMTEDWILKLAGFLNGPDADDESFSNDISVDGIVNAVDTVIEVEEEESARENWLVSLSASLVEDGNTMFLNGVCKCVSLGKSDLVRVCLTTVAWLSFSLASLDNKAFQIRALSALVSALKQCLEFGELVEHKILASLSLYNFTTIPECRRILMMKIGEEMGSCLDKLGVVTWTAKELHTIIISEQKMS